MKTLLCTSAAPAPVARSDATAADSAPWIKGVQGSSALAVAPAHANLHGFTLIEMVVTLALVGVIALVALPLYEISTVRVKESELKLALRQIRGALDAYKRAADTGQIPKLADESGYPPTLEILVTGVENPSDIHHQRIIFLRRIPRDPFYPDPTQPADQTWMLRSYASSPDAPQPGADVFDVASSSLRKALNGTNYKDW